MNRAPRFVEALGSLGVLGWLFLPVTASPAPGFQPLTGLDLLVLAGVPAAAWVFPAFVLFRWASLAVPAQWSPAVGPGSGSAAVTWFVVTLIQVLGSLATVYVWGSTPSWFASFPPTAWVFPVLGLGVNAWALVTLVEVVNRRNPVYLAYREFVRQGKHRSKDDRPRFPLDRTFDRLRRIRGKLLLAFTGIIALTLVVLSSVLLSNYETSIRKAVGDGARAQVAQAASVYKATLGAGTDDGAQGAIGMFDFINAQVKVNSGADFPFRSLGFYTDLKGRFLLDQRGSRPYPSLKPEYTTLVQDTRYPGEPDLPGPLVGALLSSVGRDGLRDPDARTVTYSAPILQNDFEKTAGGGKVRHDRLLGLAVLTYDEDVLLAPYVRTRTEVLVLTAVFLYFGIILVYIVGNLIVYPLLFLRMNVRNVSDVLRTMVRGASRVSAASLRFEDTVNSRDEIKSLSGEISDMVTVIKGIIPYVSASTLKQAETGRSSSEEKDLTFLFTDIRGFTALCEGMAPAEVVTLLNRYLDLETEIILANQGDIDKFVGDEVMAFFDGPDKEFHACRAAMEIRKAMYEEKSRRRDQGLPAVDIGIGINSGLVVFGSVGARDRMDFTSIGDTVNLAARLEGTNKVYGTKAIVAEPVYQAVKDRYICRELDLIAVMGKKQGIRIYELIQERDRATAKHEALVQTFEAGLAAYRSQDWARAVQAFGSLAEGYADRPSEVFLARIRTFEKDPPPQDWDGIFRMETK